MNRILINKLFYISSFLILFSFRGFTQETLTNLYVNSNIKSLNTADASKATYKNTKAPIELPFFDDFAKNVGYPDSTLWENDYTFVNLTYPYNPPSIGVATFDAIDKTGAVYPDAEKPHFSADTLSSKAINLDYPGNNTIFLSFYYQPGGLGDTPDKNDSLILEFYSPDSVSWDKTWYVLFNEKDSVLNEYYAYNETTKTIKGDTLTGLKHTFQQVIIPVNQNRYLKNNFRFRFRNIASVSANADLESAAGNSDHWHIDYIMLDKDRNINDTLSDDVAFSKPVGSLLKTYNAIPWTHFNKAIAYEMADTIRITYYNFTDKLQPPERFFEITDILGETGTTAFSGGTDPDIKPRERLTYLYPSDYIFPYNTSNDSALFEVKSYLTTFLTPETSYFGWNDTTRFYQKFYNYYAYDDGTAENGYGIVGESTENAMIAMQFNTYKRDTLRGIQLFFNQTLDNANQYTFKIHVWQNAGGKPGNILYTKEDVKPQSVDELNKFVLFVFDDIVIVEDQFFIGWQKQNTTEMLNVGFDVNNINNDKLYYNFSGNWIQSKFEGTVMIRPMFGHEINVATNTGPGPVENTPEFNIYPNPAQNHLNITLPGGTENNYRYSLFDTYGRIYIDKTTSESSIDISNLNPGIYFIRLTNKKGASKTKKFIVTR